jgi:RNA polymerase sigma-70 factor, ECF subfamily
MSEAGRDAELLNRLARGDDAAYRDVTSRYGPYLYGIARALTRDAGEAEDAVQETLVALLRFKSRNEASLKTVLVSILVRQAALLRRKRRGWPRLAAETPIDPPATADGSADAKMDLPVLLSGLSPEFKEVIVLRELQGMSYDEIAEVVGVPRGTVESRLHRARQQLREGVKEDPV